MRTDSRESYVFAMSLRVEDSVNWLTGVPSEIVQTTSLVLSRELRDLTITRRLQSSRKYIQGKGKTKSFHKREGSLI